MLPEAQTEQVCGLRWHELIGALEDIIARAERIEPRVVVRIDTLRAAAAAKVVSQGGPIGFATPPHMDADEARVRAIQRQLVEGGELMRMTQRELCTLALRAVRALHELRRQRALRPGRDDLIGVSPSAPVGAER